MMNRFVDSKEEQYRFEDKNRDPSVVRAVRVRGMSCIYQNDHMFFGGTKEVQMKIPGSGSLVPCLTGQGVRSEVQNEDLLGLFFTEIATVVTAAAAQSIKKTQRK